MDLCAYLQQCVHLVVCSTEDKIIPFLYVEEKKGLANLKGLGDGTCNISKQSLVEVTLARQRAKQK